MLHIFTKYKELNNIMFERGLDNEVSLSEATLLSEKNLELLKKELSSKILGNDSLSLDTLFLMKQVNLTIPKETINRAVDQDYLDAFLTTETVEEMQAKEIQAKEMEIEAMIKASEMTGESDDPYLGDL